MTSFSLASYILRIRDRQDQSSVALDSFAGGSDLYDVLVSYLQTLGTNVSLDDENRRLIKLRPPLHTDGRELSGIIETGEWGYTSELQDVRSGIVTHNRRVEESENFPFYFLISIPQDSSRGMVILQRFGNRGIRTQLLHDFQRYFSRTFSGFRIDINPSAPGRLIDQYLSREGRVTGVRLNEISRAASCAVSK